MRTIILQLDNKMYFYEPEEHAGSGYSKSFQANDLLQTIKLLIEKTIQYFSFVDFRKPFVTVELDSALVTLSDCRIDCRFANLIHNTFKTVTLTLKLHDNTYPRKTEQDVNNIVLIGDNLRDLKQMINALDNSCTKVGLEMDFQITKFMTNLIPGQSLKCRIGNIELVDKCIQLGYEINLAWATYGVLRDVFKSKISVSLKRRRRKSSMKIATKLKILQRQLAYFERN